MIIDPEGGKILPIEFVRSEMIKHPKIRAVRVNSFLYLVKKYWAAYDSESEEILLDPSVPLEHLVKVLNGKYSDLYIKSDEAWEMVFFHEAGHSLYGQDELKADEYAKKKFIEWRNETRKKIVEAIKEGVKEGFKARFKCEFL